MRLITNKLCDPLAYNICTSVVKRKLRSLSKQLLSRLCKSWLAACDLKKLQIIAGGDARDAAYVAKSTFHHLEPSAGHQDTDWRQMFTSFAEKLGMSCSASRRHCN